MKLFCRKMKSVLILEKQKETLALRKTILCQLCFSLRFQFWNGYWSFTPLGEEYQFKITSGISVSLCLAPNGSVLRDCFFGWFWGPQISWHKYPGWLSRCFPDSKSYQRYSGPILCDFYIFNASSLQISFIGMLWSIQSETSDIVQTPVQVSIESRILYHRLSSFRVSKDVKLFLFFPLENIPHCPAAKYAQPAFPSRACWFL